MLRLSRGFSALYAGKQSGRMTMGTGFAYDFSVF